jgi:UDP-glucose 4-epimerase
LHSVGLRYFNAAGADESGEIGELHNPETHLIPLVLAATAADGPDLQIYGSDYPTPDGTCIRDYIHVSDLADAHVRAMQYLETQSKEPESNALAVNLGTGRGYSILEIIKAVEDVAGRAIRLQMAARRSGDPPILAADPAKALRVLGWTAKRNLADIVSSAWAWMEKTSRESQGRVA